MNHPTRDSPAGRAYLDLQNRARREKRGTQELLTLYVVERWLARLSRSAYVEDFVLKGGMLLAAFGNRRPTVDADALARNMPGDPETVAARVAEIAALPDPDDGVEFLAETLSTRVIRDDALYSGLRVVMDARIATAAVKLRLDINFGDPVSPEPGMIELPALRPDASPIRVLGYPIETVLAEKIATAIDLGDFFFIVREYSEIYTLTRTHRLTHAPAREALLGTAEFRGTVLRPLSDSVGNIVELRFATYTAYRRSLGQDGTHLPEQFGDVVEAVAEFADRLIIDTLHPEVWEPELRRWIPAP